MRKLPLIVVFNALARLGWIMMRDVDSLLEKIGFRQNTAQ
jgi:hypothetical protein